MFISDCLQTESNTFIINNIHILRLLDHLIKIIHYLISSQIADFSFGVFNTEYVKL